MAVPDISSHAAHPIARPNPLENDAAGAILSHAVQPPVAQPLFGGDNNVQLTPEQQRGSIFT